MYYDCVMIACGIVSIAFLVFSLVLLRPESVSYSCNSKEKDKKED